jgi:hypothetical protein
MIEVETTPIGYGEYAGNGHGAGGCGSALGREGVAGAVVAPRGAESRWQAFFLEPAPVVVASSGPSTGWWARWRAWYRR